MTSYEFERALVYLAEQIIKTFGKDVGVQEPKQEPAEPLIKDEKIRKAVRAWAEACEIEPDDAIILSDLAPAFTRFYTTMYEIDIKTESSLGLDEHRDYTIAELCGEEEE